MDVAGSWVNDLSSKITLSWYPTLICFRDPACPWEKLHAVEDREGVSLVTRPAVTTLDHLRAVDRH